MNYSFDDIDKSRYIDWMIMMMMVVAVIIAVYIIAIAKAT